MRYYQNDRILAPGFSIELADDERTLRLKNEVAQPLTEHSQKLTQQEWEVINTMLRGNGLIETPLLVSLVRNISEDTALELVNEATTPETINPIKEKFEDVQQFLRRLRDRLRAVKFEIVLVLDTGYVLRYVEWTDTRDAGSNGTEI